jgi:hypothetical protein
LKCALEAGKAMPIRSSEGLRPSSRREDNFDARYLLNECLLRSAQAAGLASL